MGNIVLNVQPLQCEDPIFTHVTYQNNRWYFDLGWTSIGSYLQTIDNTVSMSLRIDCYFVNDPNPYDSVVLSTTPFIPFDTNNFVINITDYVPSFSGKDRLVFTLILAGEDSCYNETIYDIPADTYN